MEGVWFLVSVLQGRRGTDLERTGDEWAISLINYNGILHIDHDDVLERHVGCFTAVWRVSPCLDPHSICCPYHDAVFNQKPIYIFFIWVSSQASNTEI